MNAETNILSMTDLQHTALISGNKAMQLLELSRHSFEKVVKEGLLTVIHEGGKKYYQIGEIETFMETDTYQELVNGVVDARNNLNDLTGKDWLPQTKSFFYQKGLGANHPEAQIEKLHPAPYSFQKTPHPTQKPESLIMELIKAFCPKDGEGHYNGTILDPFHGSGTLGVCCEKLNAEGHHIKWLGIELEQQWCDIAEQRIADIEK